MGRFEYNMDIQQHNHRQIERLNQRGGRMPSIVDLIQAGTWGTALVAESKRPEMPSGRPIFPRTFGGRE
jgi:hypothetical protein